MGESSSDPRHAPFVAALVAPSRHASIPAEMDLYGTLLGSWRIDGTHWLEGKTEKVVLEVEFARVLDGRAIQDVWAYPTGRGASADPNDRAAGTTLRLYDPLERVWHVTWLDPAERRRVQLTARKEGADIVQIGADAQGKPRRWTFTQITATTFLWRGEHSDDGGRSWQLNAEYRAQRVPTR